MKKLIISSILSLTLLFAISCSNSESTPIQATAYTTMLGKVDYSSSDGLNQWIIIDDGSNFDALSEALSEALSDNRNDIILELRYCEDIPDNAFEYANALYSVKGEEVLEVGEFAFMNNTNVTSLNFPKAYTLGESSFEGCTSLGELWLNYEQISMLKSSTFYNCKLLTELSFDNLQKTTGEQVFALCSSLTSLSLNAQGTTALYLHEDTFEDLTTSSIDLSIGIYNLANLNVSFDNNTMSIASGSELSFKQILPLNDCQTTYSTTLTEADYSLAGDLRDRWIISDNGTSFDQLQLALSQLPDSSITLTFNQLSELPNLALTNGEDAIKSVKTISAPLVTYVGEQAFKGAENLTSISLAGAELIEADAFEQVEDLIELCIATTNENAFTTTEDDIFAYLDTESITLTIGENIDNSISIDGNELTCISSSTKAYSFKAILRQ